MGLCVRACVRACNEGNGIESAADGPLYACVRACNEGNRIESAADKLRKRAEPPLPAEKPGNGEGEEIGITCTGKVKLFADNLTMLINRRCSRPLIGRIRVHR